MSSKPLAPRERLLRLPEVETIVGFKRSTIYQMMKDGKFPKSVALSPRMVAWPESVIAQWVQDRIAESGSK